MTAASNVHGTALVGATADILDRVRAHAPRVHCITNVAAQVLTANMLLAVGAVPSLTISPDEVASFVASADALLINLGTFDANRREAVEIALDEADEDRTPWVLDPVLCDRSEARVAFARVLAAREPEVVRANQAEIAALTDRDPTPAVCDRFALDNMTVLAVTGATDLVTDGAKRLMIASGHPLMARATAVGCAGTALIAACLAVEDDPFLATAAGLLALGVAGEVAATGARGPGTLVPRLIDAVYLLDRHTLGVHAKLDGPLDVVS
ncbi:hydroxyethylthiazole kinase [Blastochloris viridis]|uniref:Hydroxyethylthiazole kinase n=1 Tax=Blastochloris viridis TaxID=1079 RepID=A0A0H5BAA9_BLAVI|nr:hydroxyethylthiazole kinase [Blastochloris viridis]ALK08730.1 Hydroxyethylthiazole kinase [Blastochloris viridis]BAR97974.1 hydroxyethylthiazole kinase [Blastochloris viridis]CUU41391.1 Hydroxyethylthiazole kinase [Blastochloris viridis]